MKNDRKVIEVCKQICARRFLFLLIPPSRLINTLLAQHCEMNSIYDREEDEKYAAKDINETHPNAVRFIIRGAHRNASSHISPGVRSQSRRLKVIFRFLRKFSCRFCCLFIAQPSTPLGAKRFVCENRHEIGDNFTWKFFFVYCTRRLEMWNDSRSNSCAGSVYTSILSPRRIVTKHQNNSSARLWIDMPALLLFPVETKAQQFFISSHFVFEGGISPLAFSNCIIREALRRQRCELMVRRREQKCDGWKILESLNWKKICSVMYSEWGWAGGTCSEAGGYWLWFIKLLNCFYCFHWWNLLSLPPWDSQEKCSEEKHVSMEKMSAVVNWRFQLKTWTQQEIKLQQDQMIQVLESTKWNYWKLSRNFPVDFSNLYSGLSDSILFDHVRYYINFISNTYKWILLSLEASAKREKPRIILGNLEIFKSLHFRNPKCWHQNVFEVQLRRSSHQTL